jgi:CheY-like chemotaxis protein
MNKVTNILLVDDGIDLLLIQRQLLKLTPEARVLLMYNGLQAYDHLTEKRAFGNEAHITPDVIICDLSMPVIDGLTFVERIRRYEHLRGVPVFILTGNNDPAIKNELLRVGATGCFYKPVDPLELKIILADIIETACKLCNYENRCA